MGTLACFELTNDGKVICGIVTSGSCSHGSCLEDKYNMLFLLRCLNPPLYNYTIRQPRILDRLRIILQCLVGESRANCIRTCDILRIRPEKYNLSSYTCVRSKPTYALIKFLISPTVCVRFIRQTILQQILAIKKRRFVQGLPSTVSHSELDARCGL